MKKIIFIMLCIVLLFNFNHIVLAASEDGTWYDTAFTITDFYNIPVVNCYNDEGFVYKFTAPATATYTIISISDYDIFGQLEDSDWDPIVWYGSSSDEDGDFELVADLTKGKTYYIWTDPDSVDVASYTMQISYEMKSGYYTYDAYTSECVITAYSGSASSVTIPSTLGGKTVIGLDRDAFYENTSLTTISFPNNIRTLGSDCFYGCTALTTVTLNKGLTSVASGAFEECTSLKTIAIPSTVTDIGSSAFEGCVSLEEVVFSEGLEIIKSSAFRDCTSLCEIAFPKSLYQLSPFVFRGCTSLNKVVFQEGLQYVKNYTFRDCTSLKEIVFPKSLLEIGGYVFRGCTALTDITFLNPNTVFDSDDDIFYKCSGFSIYGHSGSTAQTYAETYSMQFEVIEEYIPLENFDIKENILTLNVGETYRLNPIFTPSNATTQDITWQVVDKSVAAISQDGTITALQVGETTIGASLTEKYNGTTEVWMDVVNLRITSNSPGTDDSMDTENQSELKVYEPMYEYVRQFKDEYVSVYTNGVYSLVDSKNNKHYSSTQDGFGDYSENIIATYDADMNEITFNNLDGYAFTLVGYKWAGEFLGGKCVVVDCEGRYGLIDTEGNFIIECLYDEIIHDTSDTVLLCSDASWTSVTLGQSTYSLRVRSRVPALYNPVLSVTGEHIIASDGTAYGILTSDNTQITAFQYDLIRDAQNGLFVGYYGDLVDLIELDGTVTATISAYFVGGYSENKIAVFNGIKFFYVDKNGRRIVDVNIDDIISAEEFHESYAVVNVDGKGYTYIDTSGDIVTDSYWDYAARFAEGYALVMNYINDNDGNSLRKWSIIDKEFNIVMTLEDDLYIDSMSEHSTDFSDGYIRTIDRDTGLMGFIRLDEPNVDGGASNTTITGVINSYGNASEAVTIRLLNEFGNEVASTTTTKTTYELTALSGTYTLEVSKKNHVTREYKITVGADAVTQDVKIHLLGDVDGNGMVNLADYRKILAHVKGTTLLMDYSLKCANVNGDSTVNLADYRKVLAHVKGTTLLF